MDAVKVGNAISFLRKQAGLTQNELAQRLNITDKAVSRWERGIGTPNLSVLAKLSAVLDTDIEAILDGNFANKKPDCKGLLVMKYPAEITASSFLHDRRIVCFQLSFFLLAGIREIFIFGKKEDVDFTKSQLDDGKSLGVNIVYEYADNDSELKTDRSESFVQSNEQSSFIVIDDLAFWYSKDVTSTLRRLILDSDFCTEIVTYNKKPLSIKYFPSQNRLCSLGEKGKNVQFFPLLRGAVAFQIQTKKDLLDAGNIIRIIEEQQEEKVADLQEIACNRGLILYY